MTEFIQKFLLKNTVLLQKLVNEKLAKGSILPNFWNWMQIGKRNNGVHVFGKFLKFLNSYSHVYGVRMNWGRPHLTKTLFSRERETFLTGYAFMFVIMAYMCRKNVIRPLYQYSDAHLYHYDNPHHLSDRFGMYVPNHYTSYKQSAHYIEINKIFQREMIKKLTEYSDEVQLEYFSSSEKEKRTKYLRNPNYVYEPFGWEEQEELEKAAAAAAANQK